MHKLMLTAALAVCGAVSTASAAIVSYDASYEFSGATAPAGSGPWLRVTFDDQNTPGSVVLKIEDLALIGGEFVSNAKFNLNPALSAGSLNFSAPTIVGSLTVESISKATDGFSDGGAGNFDLSIDFGSSNAGGGANRFGVGESVQWTITGIPSLVATDFATSSTGGGTGAYPFMLHVQGIGANGAFSGKLSTAVPEPGSLLAVAGTGLLLSRRRRA